jgi:predicted transcriptional regulator of viral defense system
MRFSQLVDIVGDEPVFSTGLLLAGLDDVPALQRQLSGWVRTGRLVRVRKGLYALARPYRKTEPDPFVVSNQLVTPSYVSLESALHFHEIIPDVVQGVTAVTTSRVAEYETPFGRYIFHHISQDRFWGAQLMSVSHGQEALVASPEKALIDLLYLTPRSDHPAYIEELRLQNGSRIDRNVIGEMVERFGSKKVERAVRLACEYLDRESDGWVTL